MKTTYQDVIQNIKEEIKRKKETIEVEVWKNGESYVISLCHNKCVNGYYYLDDFFNENKSVSEIAEAILEEYNAYQIDAAIQFMQDHITDLMDIEKIKNKIFCRFIPRRLLDDTELPYIEKDGLIIAFYIRVFDYNGRAITTALTYELMENLNWSLTAKELFKLSLKNIKKKDGFQIEPIQSTQNVIKVYRKSQKYASTILLFPEQLQEICNRMNCKVITIYIPNEENVYISKGKNNFSEINCILEELQQTTEIYVKRFYIYEEED